MIKIRLNSILSILSELFVLSIVFVVPIVFGIFPEIYNAFELPKVLFFKVAVLLLFFTTVIKIVLNFKEFQSLARDWNSIQGAF